MKDKSSPSKLAKLLSGTFSARERDKFIAERQNLLSTDGFGAMFGTIYSAGPTSTGIFNVEFVSGTSGYSTQWPQWAYEIAHDAVLHNKQVMVTYTGDAPYGENLTGVFIQNTAA